MSIMSSILSLTGDVNGDSLLLHIITDGSMNVALTNFNDILPQCGFELKSLHILELHETWFTNLFSPSG